MNKFVLLFGGLGPTEIIVLVVLVILLFGGRKIPELMKGIGKGISEFKKGANETTEKKNEDDKKE